MSKALEGWKKKWIQPVWPVKTDLDYFNEMLSIQIDLKEDVDAAILKAIKQLHTPGFVKNMTITDRKSFLNNLGWCLEDLIHHEKKFKKYCELKIKET